jgi:hypothetical protein
MATSTKGQHYRDALRSSGPGVGGLIPPVPSRGGVRVAMHEPGLRGSGPAHGGGPVWLRVARAGRRPAMALRMSMSTNSASSLSHHHLLRNEAGPWRSPR